jgi:hypothetical protein
MFRVAKKKISRCSKMKAVNFGLRFRKMEIMNSMQTIDTGRGVSLWIAMIEKTKEAIQR